METSSASSWVTASGVPIPVWRLLTVRSAISVPTWRGSTCNSSRASLLCCIDGRLGGARPCRSHHRAHCPIAIERTALASVITENNRRVIAEPTEAAPIRSSVRLSVDLILEYSEEHG